MADQGKTGQLSSPLLKNDEDALTYSSTLVGERAHPSGMDPRQEIKIGRELGWDVIAYHKLEEVEAGKSEKDRQRISERNHQRANFVWRLKQIGLIVVKQMSLDKKDVIYKIAAPTHVLEPHAEAIGMEMRSKSKDSVTGRPLYREFSRANKDQFIPHGPRFFSSLERSRLIFSLLEESIAKGGAGLNIDKMTSQDKVLTIFPLHDRQAKQALANSWLSWDRFTGLWAYTRVILRDAFRSQPLDEVRDYFGEKIALYFAWLDWYTQFLKPLGIVGLIIFLVQAGMGLDYSNLATVIYAIILCLWGTVFAETWKRREATLAFYWDVQDFEEEERVRPEFMGPLKPGVYTESGTWVDLGYKISEGATKEAVPHNRYFSPAQRFRRIASSLSVLAVFLFVLIVGTFAILAFRVFIQADSRAGALPGGIVAGILNAVFIMVMNQVYTGIAVKMNDWENHRTDTQYEDRLIAKNFCFKFVNSYATLAFIAFAKLEPIPGWVLAVDEKNRPSEFEQGRKIMGMDIGRCKGDSCMSELFTQLMTLQITMIFVSNFIEVGVPFITKKLKTVFEVRGLKKQQQAGSRVGEESEDFESKLPYFEKEMLAPVYGGVLEEYTELFIQFGYVTLFAVAFPLSSLCALLNNLLEVKIDGFKLLMATQRPRYMCAEDIGTWQVVLEAMSYFSVASNCAIICFTSGVFKGVLADRTQPDYINCVNMCGGDKDAVANALGSYNTSDWLAVDALDQSMTDLSDCLQDCSCDSSLHTCYRLHTRIWIFVLSEHILLGVKVIMAWLIPDKPAFVEEAEARNAVEKELEDWNPAENAEADAETLRGWTESVDSTDVFDNEK